MNKKLILSTMLVGILVFGLVFVSCGNETSRLAGIWKRDNDETAFELFKDGTGVFGSKENYSITWIAENNRLKLTFSVLGTSEILVMDYKLSGSTLSVTMNGETVTLKKKK